MAFNSALDTLGVILRTNIKPSNLTIVTLTIDTPGVSMLLHTRLSQSTTIYVEVQDTATIEQITFAVRYINKDGKSYTVKESFVGFN